MAINDPNAEKRGNLQLCGTQPQQQPQQPQPQQQPKPAQPAPAPPQPEAAEGETVEPLTTQDWPYPAAAE